MSKQLLGGILISIVFHLLLLFGLNRFELTEKTNFSDKLGKSKIKTYLKVVSIKKKRKKNTPNKKGLLPKKVEKREKKETLNNDVTKSKANSGEDTEVARYLSALRSEIVKNKYKSKVATLMKMKGAVELSFKVVWPNKIIDLQLVSKSKHAPLNDSARKTIERISSIPAIPKSLKSKEIEVSIQVIYE